MKKFIITLLVSGLVFGTQVVAQHGQGNGQGKGKNKQNKEQKDKVKSVNPSDSKQVKAQDQDKNQQGKDTVGKGHAYGKNKDSLQGREFGQNRATEAKTKHEAVKNSETNIDQTTKTNDDTRAKIKDAKDKLELKKKSKKITDAEYTKKKKELDDLENQVNELDKKNNEVKDKLTKEKEVKQK